MALPKLSEALVGRMSVISLLPLCSSEYKQTGVNCIERLWKDKLAYKKYGKYDLINIIINSTYPEIAVSPGINRTQWFDDYLTTLLQREVRNVADIRNPDKIVMLLSILSLRAGSLLNNSQAASEAGLDNKTYERYKAAVTNTFLVFELQPWAKPSKINKRFIRAAKLFFHDTNLLVYLMRRDIKEIRKNDESVMGHLFENFVATEIMKNASALTDVKVSHFRTQDQKEVDFVVEKTNGDTFGIEVKLSSSVEAKDFNGLKVLREAAGKSFKKGIVVYTGNEIVPFGDKFWAVPVCYFWE
jgi:predicted AAA+ superfamily ATPase